MRQMLGVMVILAAASSASAAHREVQPAAEPATVAAVEASGAESIHGIQLQGVVTCTNSWEYYVGGTRRLAHSEYQSPELQGWYAIAGVEGEHILECTPGDRYVLTLAAQGSALAGDVPIACVGSEMQARGPVSLYAELTAHSDENGGAEFIGAGHWTGSGGAPTGFTLTRCQLGATSYLHFAPAP